MHILMIEDNESVCEMMEMFFEKENWNVTFVHDGKEGLDEYLDNSEKYNLIILDIMLPSMDGIQICREIRKVDKEVPVIMLTANAIEGAKEDYLEKGFVGYLSKPITGDKIKDMILKFAPEDLIIWRDNEESV